MLMRIILLLLIPVYIWADEVVLQNGTRYDGKITSADQDYIYLQLTDTTTAKIPHSLVKSVFFTYSDLAYLRSGKVIECKIIDEVLPDLLIVTEQGPATIKIVELKRYFYNAADSLLIPFLPATGKFFNNQKVFELKKNISGNYLILGLNAGAVNLPAKEWNNSFITAPKLLGFSAGLNIGYSLKPNLLSNLGFEYSWYPNNYQEFSSTVRRYFLYFGFTYMKKLSIMHDMYFSLGIDVGINFLQGNIYLFSYRDIDIQNTTSKPAIRPYLALQKSITNRFITRVQLGYLLGSPFTLQPQPAYLKKINIGYDGPFFMFNFYYQFPL
jgi:hypothetical protein